MSDIDPKLPFGIQYGVNQDTITSYEELTETLNSFLEGSNARKWNFRTYVTRDVAEKLLAPENKLKYEVIYSIKEINPALPDLYMVHFSTFSGSFNTDGNEPGFLPPKWREIFNKEMKISRSPLDIIERYLRRYPNYSLSNNFTAKDERQLRFFIENVFGSSYDKFLIDMQEYKGLFSCVRDEKGEIIAMGNALRDEYNGGLVHYELDHVAPAQIGIIGVLSSAVISIGLIAQILERDSMPILTTEIKSDLVQGALILGFGIPSIPGLRNDNIEEMPIQLIRKQVTIGETDDYHDLIFMILNHLQIESLYPKEVREKIIAKYNLQH